ncbi:response regulator [Halobacteriovorax marinus]|uniref:response regulator n=1 Tax=Halobacteriovorax marinus TaxID=97084 RepID=UPI0002FA4533|nr:response regulator [Halobacteriovorax marinus]
MSSTELNEQVALKKKVVVIDDEAVTRKLVEKALSERFEVYIVDNIFESIRVCELHMPDVILLDLLMPSVDGFEILNLLKHHAILCDIPVICMSSTEAREDRIRIRELGAIGFIKKPVSIKTLASDIDQSLDSVTNIITSKKNNIEFIIGFNVQEKDKFILKKIQRIPEGETVVFLSWSKGEYFYESNESLKKYIDDERLIFLEIKPTLITKFPYLQDLTPLLEDVLSFLGEKSRETHLVFDEPSVLLNFQNTEKTTSQALKFAQSLISNFKKISYIDIRPKKEDEQSFLNKIGKILVGNRG